jgi:hypothetical protein
MSNGNDKTAIITGGSCGPGARIVVRLRMVRLNSRSELFFEQTQQHFHFGREARRVSANQSHLTFMIRGMAKPANQDSQTISKRFLWKILL